MHEQMRDIGLAALEREKPDNARIPFMRHQTVIGDQGLTQADHLVIMRAAPWKVMKAIAKHRFDSGIVRRQPQADFPARSTMRHQLHTQ